MNHLDDDQLLLYAYGEANEHEGHLAGCAECRARLQSVEEARTAIDLGLERPVRSRRAWWPVAAVAAGLAGLFIARIVMVPDPPFAEFPRASWQSTLTGSTQAGYVTDNELMQLDARLTRLEQGEPYDRQN